jgi:hypothetical protein
MHYTLPKNSKSTGMDVPIGEDDYERRISLPVSEEMIESFRVGDSCHFTLIGEVVEARSSTPGGYGADNSLTLKIAEISATMDDDEYDEEQFEKGFNGRNRHH